VTAKLAASAAVIAATECPHCNARAGQGCRGKHGRVMVSTLHSARRYRAKRYRKANPEAYRMIVEMALEMPRAEFIEQLTANAPS
jgi:hypothetical protein